MLSPQELKIVEYGKAQQKTKEQVISALEKYRSSQSAQPITNVKAPPTPSYLDRVKENVGTDIASRVQRFSDIQDRPDTGALEKTVQKFGQGAGMAANALETTVGEIPGVKQTVGAIGAGINWLATSELSPIKHLGDIIGQDKTLQEVVHLYDTDKNFRDTVDGVANTARLGGDVSGAVEGANYIKNVTNKIITNVKDRAASPPTGGLAKLGKGEVPPVVKNITNDVLPTVDRLINTEVTKALDLTQGDVKNISLSTGNDVGKFMADKNLIGTNVADTVKKIKDFYKQNYDLVRSEIAKVKDIYKASDIPRYTEALTEIKKQITDVAGLQKVNSEIDALLKKKAVTLNDVQRVKELMDEHFSLYKATGDVKEGIARSGLTNIRKDLRQFIETEVKRKTGTDIKALNNNVSTARSIQDAVETRSTRGLTRATISAADILTFLTGSGFATPVGGVVAVILKKIYQSPTFKLKFAKWLDGLSDAKRLKIKQDLENGVVPPEIEALSSVIK